MFQLYDATFYQNNPMQAHGFVKLPIVYAGKLFDGNDRSGLPSEKAVKANSSGVLRCFDIESWKLDPRNYLVVEGWVREVNPGVDFGWYSMVPKRDYWRAIGSQGQEKFEEWQSQNNLMQPVADTVQTLYPSLYTFYDDQGGWVKYAKANVAEARRLATKGQRVIPFIWPQYHPSRPNRYEFVAGDYWRLQLETLAEVADGVAVWGGWDFIGGSGPITWAGAENNSEWWTATKQFIQALAAEPPLPDPEPDPGEEPDPEPEPNPLEVRVAAIESRLEKLKDI